MQDASPDARALAGLIADLFNLALFALAGLAVVDAYAPPQDLPWKPLSLADPIGLATTGKLERIVARPDVCRSFLRDQKVAFSPVPDRTQDSFCAVQNAGRVGPQGLRLDPAGPLMTCRLAAAFAIWTRQAVQPAAREILGSEATSLEHFGTYACRRIYGQAEGRPSQHAWAEAIDVAAVRLADGRRVAVLRDWNDAGPRGRFLRRIRREGCRLFRVSLSPDYNTAHYNHLHLDMSPYRLCR